MDIDDILAEVDADAIPQETRDLQELTRAWVNERSAPEILPWPEELMERVLARLRKQIELVEDTTGNPDPRANFRLIILQTELERYKYLIRSLLRARIAKIDKYAMHYLSTTTNNTSSSSPTPDPNPSSTSNLSPTELTYLTSHTSLLHTHYHASFLGQFPPNLQRMDDRQGGVDMVEGPDLEKAVFVRGRRDVGEVWGEGMEEGFLLRRGDVVVCRWGVVREVVGRGDAELI
ncbi:GINS complex subunit [Lecanora helva]